MVILTEIEIFLSRFVSKSPSFGHFYRSRNILPRFVSKSSNICHSYRSRNILPRFATKTLESAKQSDWYHFTVIKITLESGIDVGQGITVGPGKFVQKNKRRALNKHRAWRKCANLCYKKPIKLKNICRPWEKFQNLINVGPGKKSEINKRRAYSGL